jgi:kexin
VWLTASRGETGIGKWSLIVKDTRPGNNHQGKFIDWHLKLWGESIDASKAVPLPMPNEDDDDDHDVITATISGPAQTTTVPPAAEATDEDLISIPTDHPERPTKPPKPSETEDGDEKVATETDVAEEPTATSDGEEGDEGEQQESETWVSWLPTFGASKKAQIWIYGAIGLIAAFCCGLGIYFWIVRRRRLRNDSRDNYEFELLDETEAEELNGSGEKGAGGKRTRRTRGGELYDAFAGGSDDEDFEDYSDRSTERLPGDGAEHHVIGEESDDDVDEKDGARPPSGRR